MRAEGVPKEVPGCGGTALLMLMSIGLGIFALSGCDVPTEKYQPGIVATATPDPTIKPPSAKSVAKKQEQAWTEGMYEVGTDISVGKYRTIGGPSCYYSRLASLDGEDIIDNNLSDGPMVIRVKKSDVAVEFSGPCKWRKAK